MANSFKLFTKFMTSNTICKSLNQFTWLIGYLYADLLDRVNTNMIMSLIVIKSIRKTMIVIMVIFIVMIVNV